MTADLPGFGGERNSNGSGELAGMGTGSSGGIGPGRGNGYGPGGGGGYGGSVYRVGGEVAAPQLIFAVDPEFSDEARRAKFQGVWVVTLVVDAQGSPQRVHVVGHLGMGLDEKAVAAVKQYKFKPAMLEGRPVPVEVNVEVDFRIYERCVGRINVLGTRRDRVADNSQAGYHQTDGWWRPSSW